MGITYGIIKKLTQHKNRIYTIAIMIILTVCLYEVSHASKELDITDIYNKKSIADEIKSLHKIDEDIDKTIYEMNNFEYKYNKSKKYIATIIKAEDNKLYGITSNIDTFSGLTIHKI